MQKLAIKIHKLPHLTHIPSYATANSAGLDLYAAGPDILLMPLERKLIPTGIILELPEGYEAQIRPRSGLSIKHGITLVNCVGTIDADYRQEVFVPLINLSHEDFMVYSGSRIAQMIITQVPKVELVEIDASEISTTSRSGGFGSTGV